MKKKYFNFLLLTVFSYLLVIGGKLYGQTPSTMEFGNSIVVLENNTNPFHEYSTSPNQTELNGFDVSAVSSNTRLIAFANSGNGAGTNAIGSASDHVLSWLGDGLGNFTSATMTSDSGSEFGLSAMEFAYERSSGTANLNFTFQGKRDNTIVGTLELISPTHNTEINIDFTTPTTGSFSNIDEIVIIPESPITGGFSVDEMVITTAVTNTAPTISLNNSTISYRERDGALLLDVSGTVNDADGDADWNGGTLQAQITVNSEATDEISIEDIDGDGTAITISGTNILANGTDVGDLNVSGGTVTNNTALIITFDSDATNSIVQEVLQSIRYRANTTTPSTLNRTVTVTATDNNTASSNDTKTISIESVPDVTSIAVPSNATYTLGENLNFTVNFDQNVIVNTTGGTPRVELTVGSVTRYASYISGTNSSALMFRYTIQANDEDTNGIAIESISVNGGTIQNASGTNALLLVTSAGSTSSVLVDAVAPSVTSVSVPSNDTYMTGENLDFTINFNENITVNTTGGTPQLAITIGTTTRQATYQSGTGTSGLIFRYTVIAGDIDNDGIAIGALTTNGGTLRDSANNNANLTLNSVGSTIGILVSAPIELTIIGLTGSNKIYDGTTGASATGTATLSGVIGGDDVSLGGSPVFTFASVNIGTGITMNTSGYTISGTDSGKYTLTQPTLSANITAAELTIVGLTGDNKVYDGTTAASATGTATLSGVIGGDDVSLGGSPVFTFASANIGTGITMNTTGYTISGTDSGNYTLTQPTLSANISAVELTIVGLTGDDKVYDGTTIASATGTATLSGIIGGDDVSLGGSPVFTFVSANVGTGITINTTGYTISGTDSGNYTLTQPILSADITSSSVTWTGTTSNSWNTAGNWNTNSIPNSSSDVIIPDGVTNYPTISSAITVNSINIASNASLIANASVTGTVTYNRNLPTTNWYLVAAPVSGETTQDIIANHTFASGTGGNIGIGAFDNDSATDPWTYSNTGTTGPVIAGAGVSMKLAAPGDVSITGNLNVTNVSIPVETGSRNNFNLIGNPFTSYINSSVLAGSNAVIDNATFWLWDGSQYVTYNNASTINIAPAQGFFIEANTNTNVTFSTANQTHKTTNTFMRQDPKASFDLFVESDSNKSSTKVFFIKDKTTGYDYGYDSKMFGGTNYNFAVFTQLASDDNGEKLAIQTLPDNNYDAIVIPVGLIANQGKKIDFSINSQSIPNGVDIYLEDRNNNTFTNLSQENYSLTLKNDSNGIGQFYIHMSPKSLSSEDIDQNIKNISIYKSSSKEITITGLQGDAKVNVYSLLGEEMLKRDIKSNGTSAIELNNFANGVYIIRLNSSLGNITKKIVLE